MAEIKDPENTVIIELKDGPVVIDFPQVVSAGGNNAARTMLLRDVNNLTGKALKILFVAQQAVNPGRADFQTLVIKVLHLQRILQLTRHFLAVFDRNRQFCCARLGIAV